MSEPLVSIIMATFNRAHFIPAALDSIKKQSYSNWECIIIDDGGTDETESIVRNFMAKDDRFSFSKRTTQYKKGLPGSRNYGLDLSKGEYVIFFDDDDVVHPENLKTCIETIRTQGGYFVRYHKKPFFEDETIIIEYPGEVLPIPFRKKDIGKMITGKVPFASCSVMWDKQCFDKNRFDEDLMYAEEWECYSRILAAGYEGVSIDNILYFNRKHLKSNTGEFYDKNPLRQEAYAMAIKKVAQTLEKHNLITLEIRKFLLRLGFFIKDYLVIKEVLNRSDASMFQRFKYLAGYKFYAVIRPVFLFKKRIKELLP